MPPSPPGRSAPKPRRGRPRSARAEAAVLKAAAELLEEAGPARLTVEAVAARAGVGKPTIYRYWANAQELAMSALMAMEPPGPSAPPPGAARHGKADPLRALRAHLRGIVARFATPRGRQAALILATAERDSEMFKAFRHRVILTAREEGRAILETARAAGGIRSDTDIEAALDMTYGPVFFRLLTSHARLTPAFADAVVDTLARGIAGP